MTNDVDLAAGGLVWRDSDNGKELAVIHRNRYGDWTLPKGKLRGDESWTEAALREVLEETGCTVSLGNFAGCVCYKVSERPKVVLFWNMYLINEGEFEPSEEVGELRWLHPMDAIERLDYPQERKLVLNAHENIIK